MATFQISPEKLSKFRQELDQIYFDAKKNLGPKDLKHLFKMVWWARLATFFGLLVGLFSVNLAAIFFLSLGQFIRWTMIAHHVTHRGYDAVPGVPKRFKSQFFAKGFRRMLDWPDWMYPPAWNIEHNVLHHYSLNENKDPDLVVENIPKIFKTNSTILKLLTFFMIAVTWKYVYYAPSTWKQWLLKNKKGKHPRWDMRVFPRDMQAYFFSPMRHYKFYLYCILPYFSLVFVLLPALAWALVSYHAAYVLLINLVLAELLTNVHSFVVIVTNHAGPDLFRFEEPAKGKEEFYLRQILGSVNFKTGGDVNDMLHGFLNYQIEHHLYPDLSMHQLQVIQPKVKALCESYGVPYKQESVFKRLRVLYRLFADRSQMMDGNRVISQTPQPVPGEGSI